jgi:hypothetical protein
MNKRRDPLTLDLLAWEPPKVTVGFSDEVTGRGALDNRISRAISRALKDARDAGQTRAVVAKKMSDFLGRPISEDMLNKWASEASDQHRISLDAFIALIDATNCHDLIGVVTSGFGLVAVPEKYERIVTLHIAKEKKREMDAFVDRLEAEMRGLR